MGSDEASRYLIFVFSILTTLASFLSLKASWFVPTSTAKTFNAPFSSMQSVKPPVDEPTSMQLKPASDSLKASIVFQVYNRLWLTYFILLFFTSIELYIPEYKLPCLVSLCPLTYTSPDIIIAFAFSLDSANPFSTISTSSLSLGSFYGLDIFPSIINFHKILSIQTQNLLPVPFIFYVR